MCMEILKSISKYCIIIIIWILLAFFVAIIEHNSTDLSASVLSLTEQDFFEAANRDVWYKKENHIFEIFLSENNKNEGTLTVSLLYSPFEFERLTNDLTTNCDIEIISQDNWNLKLQIQWYENLDFTEWIFQLPFSWDSQDITLEYVKSENLNFSIWNLDNIDNQSH